MGYFSWQLSTIRYIIVFWVATSLVMFQDKLACQVACMRQVVMSKYLKERALVLACISHLKRLKLLA